MGELSRSSACLRIFGDDLDPNEVTRLIGCRGTAEQKKGERVQTKLGRERVVKQGNWRRDAGRLRPGNLDKQISEILAPLTFDLTVWADLSKRYKVDLYCGLWLETYNEGISLSPESMTALGERNIMIDLDVYAIDVGDD